MLPENLETGEFKIQRYYAIDSLEPLAVIAYLDSEFDAPIAHNDRYTFHFTGGRYNGILTGILFIVGTQQQINEVLFDINSRALGEKVMTVFTIPKLAFGGSFPNNATGLDYAVLAGNSTASEQTITLDDYPSNLDGYTPRNKKLLTYPYCYLGFQPQNGTSKIFRYEDFSGHTKFKAICEMNANPTVCFLPQDYKGNPNNITEMCSLSGYPTLSWKTDFYNSWLAQNQQIISIDYARSNLNYETSGKKLTTGLASSTAGNISSIMGGNIIGGIANQSIKTADTMIDTNALSKNYELDIAQMLAQVEKQQLLPDKGSMGSTNTTLLGYNYFKDIFAMWTIKAQFARKIDKYFDMYGYATNELKTPNLNNRPNWNYVKLIGSNITGNIPQKDLQNIKTLFDNGITLWHNTSNFLDYSVNNR